MQPPTNPPSFPCPFMTKNVERALFNVIMLSLMPTLLRTGELFLLLYTCLTFWMFLQEEGPEEV